MTNIDKLERCLESVGVYVELSDIEESDIDIRDFIEDSIQFITTIVEIEGSFNIEIPDELLTIDTFSSLKGLIAIIEELQNT